MLQDMFIGSVTHGDGGVFKARLRTGFFTGPFRSSAVAADYPERFAQQALGHNSKAVHHAYSKQAEVTVPSQDDWEKDWQENPQRSVQPKLLPVDIRSPLMSRAQGN
jgi:hypothetical protein